MKFLPIAIILIANLIPVCGVLHWGWNLQVLLGLYWFESFVIGLVTVARIYTSLGDWADHTAATIFFVPVYFFVWVLHGVFILIFISPLVEQAMDAASGGSGGAVGPIDTYSSVVQALCFMVAAHVIALGLDLWRTPRKDRLPSDVQWKPPFARVVMMQILILGGSRMDPSQVTLAEIVVIFAGLKIGSEFLTEGIMRAEKSKI